MGKARRVVEWVQHQNNKFLVAVRLWEEGMLVDQGVDVLSIDFDSEGDTIAWWGAWADHENVYKLEHVEVDGDELSGYAHAGGHEVEIRFSPVWRPEYDENAERWAKKRQGDKIRAALRSVVLSIDKETSPSVSSRGVARGYRVVEVTTKIPEHGWLISGAIAYRPGTRDAEYVEAPGWNGTAPEHENRIRAAIRTHGNIDRLVEYLLEQRGQKATSYGDPQPIRAPTARSAGVRYLVHALRGTPWVRT